MYIKKLLVLGVVFLSLPLVFGSVFAQQSIQSNQFVTKVGDPQGPPPNTNPLGSGTKTSAPPAPANLKEAIKGQFGIEMNNFSQQELQWTWEKFWDISHTNFFKLTTKAVLNKTGGGSVTNGCIISFGSYTDQTLFNVVLLHEIGHAIDNCAGVPNSLRVEHDNVYGNGANPLTGYGIATSFDDAGVAKSCYGYSAAGENYAEMITYYLNPGVKELTVSNNGRCIQNSVLPFGGLNHQDYFNLAKKILGTY